ncbi:RlmE family RNA methyltransferase [Candidatus Woesearchaeota archaeon]|nr:RlmE family RNA methyltransferase [Candidatus Woesearchaeota archaeon]
MGYDRQDHYYNKAKREGFRARSSYKLIEIQKKYTIIKPDDSVLDIGCAPGSWLQFVKQRTKGKILGIDLTSIKPIEGVEFIHGDINDKEIQKKIIRKFNIVLSDIAPKTSGMRERDQYISYQLSRESFLIAKKALKPKGNFVVKTFQSQETEKLVKEIKPYFEFVKRYVPQSTREGSKEIFIVALGFKNQ